MKTMIKNKPSAEIDLVSLDEETLSPEEYLNLTQEQRHNIIRVKPLVKNIGVNDLDDTSFVSLLVKWKTPRYKVKF